MKKWTAWAILNLGAILASGSPAMAGAVTFTWDPSLVVPGLVGGPASFTADAMQLTNHLRTTNTNNLTTLRQDFSGALYQTIDGFSLAGSPVAAPGLNSSYGLYFKLNPAGFFPINASGAPVGPAQYTTLDISLIADVGHDNGTISADLAGIGFSNTPGTANDVTLATGHLIAASLGLDAAGIRRAHYLTSFEPVAGQGGFFVDPLATLEWEEFLTTPPSAFEVIRLDPLTVINVVGNNGESQGLALLVPEPASIGIVIIGLMGLRMARRRVAASPGALSGHAPTNAS